MLSGANSTTGIVTGRPPGESRKRGNILFIKEPSHIFVEEGLKIHEP